MLASSPGRGGVLGSASWRIGVRDDAWRAYANDTYLSKQPLPLSSTPTAEVASALKTFGSVTPKRECTTCGDVSNARRWPSTSATGGCGDASASRTVQA
jgi:hypothetical protein